MSVDLVKDKPLSKFTKPIPEWELSEEDKQQIDKLLLDKYNIE